MFQCYDSNAFPQEYPLNTDAAGTAPPDAFGPFRVLHQIGAGALGPVFRAYQPEQDRLVAVKLFRLDLPPERTHQLVAQLERLIAADLTHAGLAAPLATGISEVSAYLAMDFVAADSLDIVIRNQELSAPADIVRVAGQLASALDLAAAIDIFHGALHPRDVLLSADDVRMTGIGIARALEEIGSSAPIRRPYTAPERAAGAAWDRRADVFSLGALVFELLTRRRIAGPGDQPFDAYAGVSGANADALDKVFDRALAERPGDRFATAGDFAKALQAAVERKRSVAGRVGPSIRTPPPEPVVAAPPSAPVPAEELPLFTDVMLGEEPDAVAASDGTPPPIADVAHEALAADLSFRDAPLSMVESLHEPHDLRPAAHEAGVHRLSIDDFNVASHEKASPIHARAWSADDHSPDAARDFALKRHEPEFDVEEVLAPDVAEASARPAPFASVAADRSSSGVWPLMLALVVGIALGFGMAMLLLGRDRVPPAPQQATATGGVRPPTEIRDEPLREVTEQTVAAAPKPAPTPPAPTANPEIPHAIAMTPVPAPSTAGAAQPSAAKPNATKPSVASSAATGRADSRVAKTPTPRPQGKTPISAPKTTPTPKGAATPTKPAANAAKAAATPAAARAANKAVAATPAKPADQTPAKAAAGSLAVDSRPTGASVYLDGKRIGTTPLVVETLGVGQYTIGLDREGYQRWATTVKILSGERSRVAASLER